MNLQEMAEVVKHRGYGSIDRIEVEPFVYEENGTVNTVVFEFDNVVITLHGDGTYSLDFKGE